MTKHSPPGKCASAAAALLLGLSGADRAPGQQPTATPLPAQSSVEEGQTHLDESFDWPQLQPERRHGALKDTKFEFNFRTYYLDRNQFDGSVSQAWAIGGWLGLKTGYFFDRVALGTTLYTSQPVYAP